jgi:hypothetical protein
MIIALHSSFGMFLPFTFHFEFYHLWSAINRRPSRRSRLRCRLHIVTETFIGRETDENM